MSPARHLTLVVFQRLSYWVQQSLSREASSVSDFLVNKNGLHTPNFAARLLFPRIPTAPAVPTEPARGHGIVNRFAISVCLKVKTCFGELRIDL